MTEEQSRAVAELTTKTIAQIQFDTAITWAHRAWAARQLGLTFDAVEYEHEAIEHAALCGADDALAYVRRIIAGP